jgi:hypothetical protein
MGSLITGERVRNVNEITGLQPQQGVIEPLTEEQRAELEWLWVQMNKRLRIAHRDWERAKKAYVVEVLRGRAELASMGQVTVATAELVERCKKEEEGYQSFVLLADQMERVVRIMVQTRGHAVAMSVLNDQLGEVNKELNLPKLQQLQTTFWNLAKEMQQKLSVMQMSALAPAIAAPEKLDHAPGVGVLSKRSYEAIHGQPPPQPPADHTVVNLDDELLNLPAPPANGNGSAKKQKRDKDKVPVSS